MHDIGAIAAFVRAAETHSFTQAARDLNMTPSGVSKAVSRLENRLGVRLLARTTRRVSLTPDGSAFYRDCRQILADLDAAERALLDQRATPRGRLRVSAPVGFARRVIVPQLARLLAANPELSVELNVTNRYVELLEEGVDVVIRIGEVNDPQVVARPLTRTGYVLCAAPDYFARRGRPEHPDQLAEHACVGFVWPGTRNLMPWQFQVDGKPRQFLPAGPLKVDQSEAWLDAGLAGMGLIWSHDYMVDSAIAAGRLEPVLAQYALPPVPVSLVYSHHRHPSPRLRAFVDFMLQAVPQRPPWSPAA